VKTLKATKVAEQIKGVCAKCGEPIHIERFQEQETGKWKEDWLHDDYKEAWQVDGDGVARNLHFAAVEAK
jgi:glycerol-3-phosphate O-acyltransferase